VSTFFGVPATTMLTGDDLRGVCHVDCVRSAVVPPSASAAVKRAEQVFQQHIASTLMSCEQHSCSFVQALHGEVQQGNVRRVMAGHLASGLYDSSCVTNAPTNSTALVTLLWLVQQHQNITRPCRCLECVLSWGTCPHVAWTVHTADAVVTVGTAFAVSSLTPHQRRMLLAAGCPPWHVTRCCESARAGLDVLEAVVVWDRIPSLFQPWSALRLQWLRWHVRARRGRRTWLYMLAGGANAA
jgi:hypothetical protein